MVHVYSGELLRAAGLTMNNLHLPEAQGHRWPAIPPPQASSVGPQGRGGSSQVLRPEAPRVVGGGEVRS